MSTLNLLQQSVVYAQDEADAQVLGLPERYQDILNLHPDLRTKQEAALVTLIEGVLEARRNNLPIVNIATAIRTGGVKDKFPCLALATYEASIKRLEVQVRVNSDGSARFYSEVFMHSSSVDLPAGTLPRAGFFSSWYYPVSATTIVPLVPPALRQSDASGHLVLFEVSEWGEFRSAALDPYLLKQIAGNIYSVVGSWDITELELEAYQKARTLGINL